MVKTEPTQAEDTLRTLARCHECDGKARLHQDLLGWAGCDHLACDARHKPCQACLDHPGWSKEGRELVEWLVANKIPHRFCNAPIGDCNCFFGAARTLKEEMDG